MHSELRAPAGPPVPPLGGTTPVVRRRSALPAVLVVGALLAGGTALAAAATRVEAVPELRQMTEPVAAAQGWGPSWVDEEGRPARWDPCTPIRYVVNPGWMPHAGREDLAEAMRRITAVSGLQFVDDGDTDELPSRDRPAYQPERYGERWAPLLVTWVPPASTDVGIGGGIQGVSLAVAVPGAQGGSIVTGQVVLDADRRLASGFGPGSTDGEVLLHELAHAVGLGHVDDPTQVMYASTTNSESQFGAGDRAGLTALGAAAGCHPAPEPRPLRFAD